MPVKKAYRKINKELKTDPEGNLVIESKADAFLAVSRAGQLLTAIDAAKRAVAPATKEYELIRKALNVYQSENELAEIEFDGWRSDFVERSDGGQWIWDEDDIPKNIDASEQVVPLKKLLRRIRDKVKRQMITDSITRTTIDRAALDDAVKRGLIDHELIAPAYIEAIKTTYVQIKEVKK
jgi:hypothetical protein